MFLELYKLIILLFFEAGVLEIALVDHVFFDKRLPAIELRLNLHSWRFFDRLKGLQGPTSTFDRHFTTKTLRVWRGLEMLGWRFTIWFFLVAILFLICVNNLLHKFLGGVPERFLLAVFL